MELTFSSILILTLTGFLAGGINTLAGGGSNLTIPALMVLGLPADIANGTNRIAILLQSVVGIVGGLRYDLIRANALKMACSIAFTTVAVAIFIFLDKVWWVPGLILALGSIIGRLLTMKIAVKASQSSIKSFLFLMTLCAVIAGFIF